MGEKPTGKRDDAELTQFGGELLLYENSTAWLSVSPETAVDVKENR